jgi:hypothetical protein
MRIVIITLPIQSQDNEWSCVLLPLHYLYKAMKMSGYVYCYITLPVQSKENERSCVLLPTIHITDHFHGFVQVV